ncbi:hypothetical protein V865_006638 [Kwoniella europaea PYCC6329]|uniref:Uncharacterized protein n=1 Tax=Kwoniella europaea PYCC6329 TaxID=1423913 RepID=A0AAX4KQ40_9TREE
MSSSPFPQLLKRAHISTYDPLITRIYTSTPSSKSQHSDWGLKFPVPIKKGPRYIKFNSLDAGPGVNCDWRSGEREARFVQAWGDGTVRWQNEDEVQALPFLTKAQTAAFSRNAQSDDYLTEQIPSSESAEDQLWMKDVESMSEKEFELYLDKIRKGRKEFLDQKLNDISTSIKETLVLPEDNTLIHLSYTGKTPSNSTLNYQAALTTSELRDVRSNKLNSKPHRTNGLVYSAKPTSSNEYLDTSSKKGRVLNKVSRYDNTQNTSRSLMGGGGNNLPWIVSLGGLTGKTITNNNRFTDSNVGGNAYMNNSIDQTDYTRSDTSAGVGKFRINRAEMGSNPPSVLALKDSKYTNNGTKLTGRWRQSTANQPSPLDTFRFDIDLSITDIESEVDGAGAGVGVGQPGSREWVGNESKLNKLSMGTWQDELNLGGPRRERQKGEALDKLKKKEREATKETMSRLHRLLNKHKVEAEVKETEDGQ